MQRTLALFFLVAGLTGLGASRPVQSSEQVSHITPLYVIVDQQKWTREYYPTMNEALYMVQVHNSNYNRVGLPGYVRLEGYYEFYLPRVGGISFVLLDQRQGTREFHYSFYRAISAWNAHNANYSRIGQPSPVILEGMTIPGRPGIHRIPSRFIPA